MYVGARKAGSIYRIKHFSLESTDLETDLKVILENYFNLISLYVAVAKRFMQSLHVERGMSSQGREMISSAPSFGKTSTRKILYSFLKSMPQAGHGNTREISKEGNKNYPGAARKALQCEVKGI